MARPKKTGLDYFPFDVDFFSHEKMICIAGEFGLKGYLVAVALLCAVYRNGYFVLWNDATRFRLLRDLPGISDQLLRQIVDRLVYWKLFDEQLFLSAAVLTSRSIQQIYFDAVKRRSLSAAELPYLLVSVNINGVSVNNNPVSVNIYPQSKVKENKINTLSKSPPNVSAPVSAAAPTRQGAEWGEDFLKEIYDSTSPEVMRSRLDALGVDWAQFSSVARMVFAEWNSFGISHPSRNGAVRHLFNHVRKKLRSNPSLLNSAKTAARARLDTQIRQAERDERAESDRQYRLSVQTTGKNGWQQYCANRGIDPESSAADLSLQPR